MKIILERMIRHVDGELRPEQAGSEVAGRVSVKITHSIVIEQAVQMRSPLHRPPLNIRHEPDYIRQKL